MPNRPLTPLLFFALDRIQPVTVTVYFSELMHLRMRSHASVRTMACG